MSLKSLSPSSFYQILLDCLTPRQASQSFSHQQLQQTQDWETIIQYSLQVGIFPLLAHRILESGETIVPLSTLENIKELYQRNALRNIHLARLLIQVVELLHGNDIPCIAYKGPAVAVQAYGDLSLRQFNDLDLLIHPENFSDTYQLLLQFSFTPQTPLSYQEQKLLVKTGVEFSFHHQSDILEIHWNLSLPELLHPLHTSLFWDQVTPLEILNRSVQTFSPQFAAFFTCFHATKHAWESLRWIADLAYYTYSYPNLDWLALLDFSRRSGFHRLLCLSLLLGENQAGINLPTQVSKRINLDQCAKSLSLKVSTRLASPSPPLSPPRRLFFFLQTREHFRDQLYILFTQQFAPREIDWRTLPLPSSLFLLYYLIRPIRVIFKSFYFLSNYLIKKIQLVFSK